MILPTDDKVLTHDQILEQFDDMFRRMNPKGKLSDRIATMEKIAQHIGNVRHCKIVVAFDQTGKLTARPR